MTEKQMVENRCKALMLLKDLIDNIEEHLEDAHLVTIADTEHGTCFEIARNFGEGGVYLCIVFGTTGYATVNLYNGGTHTFDVHRDDIDRILEALG